MNKLDSKIINEVKYLSLDMIKKQEVVIQVFV